MIEHIIITVLICFTVMFTILIVCSTLQTRWKRQNDELTMQRRRNAYKVDLDQFEKEQ